MPVISPVLLPINGFTLALALGFLLIIAWYDIHRIINQFFAIFLAMATIWNAGFFLVQIALLLELPLSFMGFASGIAEIGFSGASVALYVLVTILAGIHTRRFRILAFISLCVALAYNGLLIITRREIGIQPSSGVSFFYFLIFDILTLYFLVSYRRKIQNVGIIAGITIFILGQLFNFLNPASGIASLSATIGATGALILSFALVQQEMITPLKNQRSQLEAMQRVSLAITGGIATNSVLKDITEQAVEWLGADAACIFIKKEDGLELVAPYHLPERFVGWRIQAEGTLAGKVTTERKSVFVENYKRDWQGNHDMPLAIETFGSVIGVPLTSDEQVMGVLMVITGVQGRLLGKEDMHRLELLSSQASIAITHGQLFAEQQTLADQLKKLLISTENPVLAIDRKLRLIFANPSAEKLFAIHGADVGGSILNLIPAATLPPNYRTVLKEMRQNRVYIYEISLAGKIFFCHLAGLGDKRIEGWVAVLNDVTELKELDRIKSEVVRMTSHDLKNPLQAALANLDNLRDDVTDNNREGVLLAASKIEKHLERMNRIIGGILDLERARMSLTRLDLCTPADIITNAIDEVLDIALEKNVELQVDLGTETSDFRGDTGQFGRAMVNLIENAIKFTPEGGSVRVQAYNDDECVTITVSDTGIGIPPEIQPHIFDRFFRGQQPGAEHISGSGLGLSLVKAVVEHHRGTIRVESEMGKGTTFILSIPAAH